MKIWKRVGLFSGLCLVVVCMGLGNFCGREARGAETVSNTSIVGQIDEKTVLAFDFGPGEITGDKVIDLSGNGNDGKRLNEWTRWADGKKGDKDQAVAFNADAWTYLGVEKSETLTSPKDGLTIELWLKLNGAPDYPNSAYLINFMGSDGKSGYALGMAKDKLSFVFGNGTNNMYLAVDSKSCLEPGKWQHVAATWDGKMMRIYVDEKKVAETHDPYSKPNISYENMPKELIIGTRTNAVLDEIRISSVARY